MPLLPLEEARTLTHAFDGKAGALLFRFLRHITSLDDLSDVYDACARDTGADFARNVLDHTGADYMVGGADNLRKLPDGPFITVSNHPYGGIDGVVLVDLFGHLRPDYKVMVNKMLGAMKALSPSIITVTPTGTRRTAPTSESLKGVRLSMEHVRDGHPLGLFPSGAVSDLRVRTMKIEDRPWQEAVVRMIVKMNVPVIPVRFFDRNSMYYYLLGVISWKLRLTRLCREGINKAGKRIRVGIGEPVLPDMLKALGDVSSQSAFLREKVYGMPLPGDFIPRGELPLIQP